MERWRTIEDFPGYEVSDQGQIRNPQGRLLGIYDNGHGVLQVVIRRDGKPFARAVHRLVADAFIGVESRDFVPMHIDGDRTNNAAENLVWKPRWFANKMTRQKHQAKPKDRRAIKIVQTGEVFANAYECAQHIGGIEDMVIVAAQSSNTSYMRRNFVFV